MKLTPEILFGAEPLQGQGPSDFSFSPDGRYLAYRATAADDRERRDLYRVDLDTGRTELWLSADAFAATSSDVSALTAEERAERERRRDFSHGITRFIWRPQHPQVLLPIDGQAYLLGYDEPPEAARALCPAGTRQTAFAFDPAGDYLAYVRDGDLFVLDLLQGVERQMTERQHDLEKFGLPDFLAAEEMHRFEGYWWGPGGSLYYTRVDESPVPISHRLEIDSGGSRTIDQRYPYAGGTNPLVELWWRADLDAPAQRVWQQDARFCYLAQLFTGKDIAVMAVQDRLQQTLRYLVHKGGDEWQTLYEETSATWVNLSDDFLQHGETLFLTDEVKGTRQVISLGASGVTRLEGPEHVNRLLGIREGALYVSGWQDTPTENHLFRMDLDSGTFTRLTDRTGWHGLTLAPRGSRYVEQFSAVDEWLHVRLRDLHSPQASDLYREVVDKQHPYFPFYPLRARAEFGETHSEDGHRLCYRLTPPVETAGRHPVILYVYGGPGAQKVRNEWGSLLPQLFAHHGFGVLEIDNRGSTNRGREFEAPLYRRMGSIEIQDQIKGLEILEEVAWADPDNVAVFGHSYGGYMTLMCLTQCPQRFKAGIAVAPVCDWRLYDSHYTERYMGLPDDNQNGYHDGNVLTHLGALNSPLLLMHGMADDNVLFTHTTMIMSELQRLNKSFELMTYPGAKHSMQERHVSVHRFNLMLSFLERNLR